MGYTHYFTFKKTKTVAEAWALEKKYQRAIRACQKLIYNYAQNNGGLSGYNAHSKPGAYGGISVNGSRENGHEDFVLAKTLAENYQSDFWGFCKTAQKPYDIVVVACLIILKHYLGEYIDVNSDGDAPDWVPGLMLAMHETGLKRLKIPSSIRRVGKTVTIAV